MPRLARLTLVTTVLSFLLAAVGGLVRATDSGLACPGWPKCYGRWIPPADHHAIIEMSHRYLASAVSIGVIATCVVAVLFHRQDKVALGLGLAIVPLVVAQALLGAYVVHHDLEAWTVVAHLGLGMAFAATLITLTVHLNVARTGVGDRGTRRLLGFGALAVFAQLLLGSWVTGRGAGLAFSDWPLYGGRLIPDLAGREDAALQFAHRTWAYVLAVVVVLCARRARRLYPGGSPPAAFATAAAVLVFVQIGLGVLNIASHLHSAVVTAHLATATLIWGALVAAWASARRTEAVPVGATAPAPADPRSRLGFGPTVTAYVALTKPRIIELLLVTTVPTMIVAARGMPSVWLMVVTVVGGTLAAGGANAINMVVDRDIDKLMQRTAKRPLVTGAMTPRAALTFALVLEALAFIELAVLVNLLSAVLAVSATLFYVFVYTLWLKRRSSQNIVIGGAAGAVPVLVGWSAVTGSLGWAPVVLFAIIFVWTPPHFWALAIKYRDDYAAAQVPMLPAVASTQHTARRIVAYTVLLWAVSMLFAEVGRMGDIYLATAIVLGAGFLALAVKLLRDGTMQASMRLFGYSISYVTLLFSSMALDQLVRH
ncbi:MAG: heme o synthase [Actinomycetota bacterium]|jgi:protoheme IX farnesyltransferase|nr:heme o synthase [Actinomycetota bacterium]